MYNNVIVPHYAAEHNDHTRGTILRLEKLEDCHRELRDIGDGLYRLSVYKPLAEDTTQTEWDFTEYDDYEEALEMFFTVDAYDDLNKLVADI